MLVGKARESGSLYVSHFLDCSASGPEEVQRIAQRLRRMLPDAGLVSARQVAPPPTGGHGGEPSAEPAKVKVEEKPTVEQLANS